MDESHLLKKPLTNEQWRRRMELFAGLLKQALTLDTASIIMVTAMSGGFFDEPKQPLWLGLAVLTFILSIVGCFMGLFIATLRMDETYQEEKGDAKLFEWSGTVGLGFLLVGLGFLAVFVWVNIVL